MNTTKRLKKYFYKILSLGGWAHGLLLSPTHWLSPKAKPMYNNKERYEKKWSSVGSWPPLGQAWETVQQGSTIQAEISQKFCDNAVNFSSNLRVFSCPAECDGAHWMQLTEGFKKGGLPASQPSKNTPVPNNFASHIQVHFVQRPPKRTRHPPWDNPWYNLIASLSAPTLPHSNIGEVAASSVVVN